MEPFVAQLKQLCADHPTRAKWVIVPSHAIGRTLGDRLVLSGTDWANLRFVTPLDLALRMGAPFLVERGIDPSEEGLGPALMMRLLLGLPEEHSYFRPQASQPELARALWSTLTELRMAGVGPEQLARAAFESDAKRDELCALLAAYEQFLITEKRGDRATVFAEAVKHLDWSPIQKQDCWTELPDTIWSPLERRLLEMLPGERIAPRTLRPTDAAVPRRLRSEPPNQTSEPLNLGTSEPRNPQSQPPVSFFQAGGSEAEIEEVFRRILTTGCPIDDVEIVCPQSASAPLVWEKAMRHEWAVTLADGIPSSLTRPGRALLALIDWIEDNFAAGHLRKLLQSGDVAFPKAASMSPGQAARLLVKAEAAWGRKTYGLSLGRLARSERAYAKRDDLSESQREGALARADQADELAAWISALIDSVPEPADDGLIDLQALVTCAERFIEEIAARSSALDAGAIAALTAALKEFHALGDYRCSLAQGLRFIAERGSVHGVGRDRPRPGHLHVSTLSRAGLSGRRHIFIVGLEEGKVFPSAFEDPILLDAERAGIESSLSLAGDRVDESVFAALTRLEVLTSSPDVHLCLSYSCRDLREFRHTYASWLMLNVFRSATNQPDATYGDMRDALGQPVSCVPDEGQVATDQSRWWLRGLVKAGEAGRAELLKQYPPINYGLRAAAARKTEQFTEYDGFVPEAGPVLDPANPTRVVSPTDLEKAAACPFKYFLERGLGVRAIESGDRDRDLWLNPLLRGSLLHDLYANCMRRARGAKRAIAVNADRDWLLDEGRKALAELSVEMPAPSAEVEERESADLLHDLELFVEAEAAREGHSVPCGFEVPFGRGEAPEEDLAFAEPIAIDIGGGLSIRLAGRIDRIDQLIESGKPSVRFEIIDYKTGKFWPQQWDGVFAGGTRLQHALYGLAATELLRRKYKNASVVGATYYHSSAKGKQHRKVIEAQSIAKVTEVLTDLRNVIAAGAFVHAHAEESCKFCDYGYACGGEAFACAEAKCGDPSLASFIKLGRHE